MTRVTQWFGALAVVIATSVAGCTQGAAGTSTAAPNAVPADSTVRYPWTGPKHADGRDIARLGDRIRPGMREAEVAAVIGRPSRIAAMRHNHFWFYRTADGDLRIFFNRAGIVQCWDGQVTPLSYKTPSTRTANEMFSRVRVGMAPNALMEAVGTPDSWTAADAMDPAAGSGPSGADELWQVVYRCRDGDLLLLVEGTDHTVLTRTIVPARNDRQSAPPTGA